MAVKAGYFSNPNENIFETHLLRRKNLPVPARQTFPNSSFASYPERKTSILRIRAAEESNSAVNVSTTSEVKGSGTTARGRRLIKIREEKTKRDFDRLHNYPSWAKVLEDACKDDEELRAVLGDSIGEPEEMRKRIEERVRKKGRDFNKKRTGSVLSFRVSFRDFNPQDSYIWFEYGSPSDREVHLVGCVIQSWYVMGRLGAFNSSNLQLTNASMEYDPLYDADKAFNVMMPSSFHDIGDVEFQDNWGRVWVDLGTSDFFPIDVLLNCMTVLSADYLGIQQSFWWSTDGRLGRGYDKPRLRLQVLQNLNQMSIQTQTEEVFLWLARHEEVEIMVLELKLSQPGSSSSLLTYNGVMV